MTTYISPENEYPRYVGDVQIEAPDFMNGDTPPSGWKIVVPTGVPVNEDIDYIVEELFPEEIDGIWYQKWNLRELTSEEKEIRDAPQSLRSKLEALGLTPYEVSLLRLGRF